MSSVIISLFFFFLVGIPYNTIMYKLYKPIYKFICVYLISTNFRVCTPKLTINN